MRLNNFSQNIIMQSKQQQNTKESIGLQSSTQIEPNIKIRLSNENRQFRPKEKESQNQNYLQKGQLVSQKMKRSKFSCFNTLGTLMLKIMSFQSIHNGYSSTKLSIIKAINDIESNKIHTRFLNFFNFKKSSYHMMGILNKSLKQINQELAAIRPKQKYDKSHLMYEIENIKIHKIIMNHIKTSSILSQFFHVFFTSLLLLVNYPLQKLLLVNQNSKEILYILCDYLACNLVEKSQKLIIDKTHYIQLTENYVEFGSVQQKQIKSMKILDQHILSKNFQSRSTHNLQAGRRQKQNKNTHSTGYKNKNSPHELSSHSSKEELKNSIFLIKQPKLKKYESRIKVNFKENSMNNSKISSKIISRDISPKKVNSAKKLFIQQNQRMSIGQINQRSLLKKTSLKVINQFGFRCQKCLMKKQLKFVSQVVNLQVK